MVSHLQHVVITGASSGLGKALAVVYASQHEALTLIGRDEKRLGAVVELCRSSSPDVSSSLCDVTDAASMRDRLMFADDQRPIDILVANAGIGGASVLAPPLGESSDLVRTIFETNTLGVVNTITPLIERFVARRRGQIVVIASLAAFEGLPDAPAYSASKAAVRMYGHGLRRLLAPQGVAVTIVSPGFIETPMSASLPMRPLFPCSPDKAALKIVRGVARRKSEIVFPWQLRAAAAATKFLPAIALDGILAAGRPSTKTSQ